MMEVLFYLLWWLGGAAFALKVWASGNDGGYDHSGSVAANVIFHLVACAIFGPLIGLLWLLLIAIDGDGR